MYRLFLAFSISLLFSCSAGSSDKKTEEKSLPIQEFDKLSSDFIDSNWKLNPISASYNGFHDYDYMLPIPNKKRDEERLVFAEDWLKKLGEYNFEELTENEKIDYKIIEDQLKSYDFYINRYESKKWNPSNFNLGGAFFQVINYREKSIEKRLEDLNKKLDQVPAYYEAAKARINNPTAVHTKLAIKQLEGSKSVFTETLLDSLKVSKHETAFKNDFKQKISNATNAINGFIENLKSIEADLVESGKDFRIGKELFEEKFTFDIQSRYSANEIFLAAIEEKEKLHEELFRISGDLWENYFPNQEKPGGRFEQIQMVIDKVADKHVHRDSFVTAIRQQIPKLEKFVVENDLLTLDPNKPLIVRETPKYMRGIAGASISAPGPYDKDAETYYNVTPLDNYTEEEAESYLREYNQYTLQILNIHEAIPGHYTQLIYSNQSPSLIKSIFGNGAMVEGWAVYSELMMLENGYGEDMEIGLMYYKWNLRTVCNTILDYGIHVLDYSKVDAMQLLMTEAFQEKSEAEGKWKRAKLSQVQLCSYFTGFYEIRALREEIKSIQGEGFSLKEFHEQFLSYGSAPVKYIRELMLKKLEKSMKTES